MKKMRIAAVLLAALLIGTAGCNKSDVNIIGIGTDSNQTEKIAETEKTKTEYSDGTVREQETYGEDLTDSEIYNGYFEETDSDINVTLVSGTDGCWKLEDGTLRFSGITEDTVYAVSGKLCGNIYVETDSELKLGLELTGFSLVSNKNCPVEAVSCKKLTVTAKKGTENYIYDKREAVGEDETLHTAAIYAASDLEISGKGELTVVSDNNNGIHAKDDLEIKNLTLSVVCNDNAVKGNDSVTLCDVGAILIAKKGDGIKTSNSGVSEKGKQKGTVSISGGTYTVYAACDGIDAAYNAEIAGDNTVLTIYTDKYSEYSEDVEKSGSDENRENLCFIRFTSKNYQYSVKYYNSDTDYKWANAQYYSTVSGGMTNYYYYSYEKLTGYKKIQFFVYSSDQKQGQETDCLVSSDYLEYNSSYDTFALSSRGNSLSYSWTNYTTQISDGWGGGRGPGGGGPGGMADGNSDKGDHSTKGIKAANEINIADGSINIKSYDDSIHAGSDSALESGENASGNVNILGGSISLYSNDDGVHADGILSVSNGNIDITNCYEGLEGTQILISGGDISIIATDDGMNSTATTGNGITFTGGKTYIYCTGDGIDSNSRTSYQGIVFGGGDVVVISNSSMNSSIDTEQGYTYSGGRVIAVMPSSGMTSETTNCKTFSSVAATKNISFSEGAYLTVTVGGETAAAVKMPLSISSKVIYLGSKSATLSSEKSFNGELDSNGVCWSKAKVI